MFSLPRYTKGSDSNKNDIKFIEVCCTATNILTSGLVKQQ